MEKSNSVVIEKDENYKIVCTPWMMILFNFILSVSQPDTVDTLIFYWIMYYYFYSNWIYIERCSWLAKNNYISYCRKTISKSACDKYIILITYYRIQHKTSYIRKENIIGSLIPMVIFPIIVWARSRYIFLIRFESGFGILEIRWRL